MVDWLFRVLNAKEEVELEEKEFKLGGPAWTQWLFEKGRISKGDQKLLLTSTYGSWDPEKMIDKMQVLLSSVHEKDARYSPFKPGERRGSGGGGFRRLVKKNVGGKKTYTLVEEDGTETYFGAAGSGSEPEEEYPATALQQEHLSPKRTELIADRVWCDPIRVKHTRICQMCVPCAFLQLLFP